MDLRKEEEAVPGWIIDNKVLPNDKLKQGDLVIFSEQNDYLRKCGIIVTADCDLKNSKHARMITMVPIVSVSVILEHYLIPEDCEKKRQIIENYVYKSYDITDKNDEYTKIAILRDAYLKEDPQTIHPRRIGAEFILDINDKITVKNYKILYTAIKTNPKKARLS